MKVVLRSAVACAFMLGLAVEVQSEVPRMGPPQPPAEAIPAVPAAHPTWVWRPGHYRWHGGRYVWVSGVYVQPPHAGYRWYSGRWRQTSSGWIWVRGRWR